VTIDQLFDLLTQATPSFDRVRRAHVEAYQEVLPHLLVSELLAFIESRFSGVLWAEVEAPNMDEIRALFEVLEAGLEQGDDYTVDAIAVSFVEGIDGSPHYAELRPFFGPIMCQTLAAQQNWKPAY